VRGAVRWSFEEGELDTALAIFASLERFWSARGCPADLLALADTAVEQAGESVDAGLRARAAWVAGFQAARAGEYERPARLYEQSLGLFRRLGKDFEVVRCLSELAILRQEHGLGAEASALAEEALTLAQALGEPRAVAAAATCLATLAYFNSDFARAAELYEEALRANREAGAVPAPIASSLYNIGLAARALGDRDRAERALREALEVATEAGNAVFIGNSAVGLGYVMLARRDSVSARSFLRQGLDVVVQLGNPGWTGSAFNLAATICAAEGDDPSAARLWGAADALLEIAESPVEADDERVRKAFEPSTRSALGASRFASLAEEGRRLPVEEAVRFAMDPQNEES